MSFAEVRDQRGDHPVRGPDWDDLKLFLQVCQSGSFRAAAHLSGQAHNTIARRIGQLEQHYGRVFLRRQPQGVEITPEGRLLAQEAARIQTQLDNLGRDLHRLAQEGAGAIRAEVEETAAQFWLLPRLRDFLASEPAAEPQLRAVARPGHVMADALDVTIDWRMPAHDAAIVRRLGRAHFVAAASHVYFAGRRAMAQPIHTVVEAGGGAGLPALADSLGLAPQTPVLTSLSAEAALNAIRGGAGIGWLPDFIVASDASLRRVGTAAASRDLHLAYHPDSGRIARIRRFIDWCVAQFDARQDWFRDDPAGGSAGA